MRRRSPDAERTRGLRRGCDRLGVEATAKPGRGADPGRCDRLGVEMAESEPRLNRMLEAAGFDAFVAGLCARFYAAKTGWPNLG